MRIIDLFRKRLSGSVEKELQPVTTPRNPCFRIIEEPYSGAWQRGDSEKTVGNITSYSTVYACLSRIAKDIGKLPFQLKARDNHGLWVETTNPAYSPVLRKPNRYQTPAQFREAWVLSKLQHGNTYVLKERDARGVVTDLHVLDPHRVEPLVSESGLVFYRLFYSTANNLLPREYDGTQITIPASEVIHDREVALFHPLVGVAPIAAAYLAARKNIVIQETGAAFFENGARVSGVLTVPSGIDEDDAKDLQKFWNQNFTGRNAGRVAVVGSDAKYAQIADNASNAQLVEQLKYSDQQICHAFGVPPFKVGIGQLPAGLKTDDLNQTYYADALQARIEAMEDCLDEGLGLGDNIGVELNLEPLLRMDAQKLADVEGALVKNGIKAPNEARRRFGLAPLVGGDSVYLQQQNFSLEALARRDQSADPFGTGKALDEALSPGLAMLKGLTERTRKRRLRFDRATGDWQDLGPLAA